MSFFSSWFVFELRDARVHYTLGQLTSESRGAKRPWTMCNEYYSPRLPVISDLRKRGRAGESAVAPRRQREPGGGSSPIYLWR